MEGARIRKSQYPEESCLIKNEYLYRMLYERVKFCLCYNSAFCEIMLEQFIYPDQMAETEQV